MKKKMILRFISIFLLLGLVVGCGGDKEDSIKNKDNETTKEETSEDPKSPEAAFSQFGVDVEKVKPNLYTPDEEMIKLTNVVDLETVYYRKAAWKETSESGVDMAEGQAYNQRVYEYIKSIAEDNKIYQNVSMNGKEAAEVTSYEEISTDTLMITFSYKYNSIWIDVYFDYIDGLGNDIGVNMNGSGTY
jgi:hypothetical protein